MRINNRRYIGCKTKLLDNIYDSIVKRGYNSEYSFADLFSGTGVVGYYFVSKGYEVLLNDLLYSNYLSYVAWLGNQKIDEDKIKEFIKKYNSISACNLDDNYFSKIYGAKYFSIEDAKVIGYIRDDIEKNKNLLNEREYAYLIISLMYAIDKISNTVGHFESFLNKDPITHGVVLNELDVLKGANKVEIYNEDANILAKKINYDIVYIDPPYNARQYVNFYHVLENLCRWNKPTEFEGNSMKFKRDELKSEYCKKNAKEIFEKLISTLKCKLIVVSYNNTYNAKSTSSNNKITKEDIINILSKRGKVEIEQFDYKFFNSGKTSFEGHKEYLFICEVK